MVNKIKLQKEQRNLAKNKINILKYDKGKLKISLTS